MQICGCRLTLLYRVSIDVIKVAKFYGVKTDFHVPVKIFFYYFVRHFIGSLSTRPALAHNAASDKTICLGYDALLKPDSAKY